MGDKFSLIGNAVAPIVAERIAITIGEQVFGLAPPMTATANQPAAHAL